MYASGETGKGGANRKDADLGRKGCEPTPDDFRRLLIVFDALQRIAEAAAHYHDRGKKRCNGERRRGIKSGHKHIVRRQHDAVSPLGDRREVEGQEFEERQQGQGRKCEIVALKAEQRIREGRRCDGACKQGC